MQSNALVQCCACACACACVHMYFCYLPQVLGRNVYSSNAQLGGVQIMHNNGVSHLTVRDDFSGVTAMLKWLSYVPKSRNSPLPVLPVSDSIHRSVDFTPTKAPYDPRCMLAGRPKPGKIPLAEAPSDSSSELLYL